MEKAVSEILVRLFQLAPQQFAPHLHTSLVLVRKKKKSTDWPVSAEVARLVLPAQAGTQLWSVLVAIAAFAIRRSFSAVRASQLHRPAWPVRGSLQPVQGVRAPGHRDKGLGVCACASATPTIPQLSLAKLESRDFHRPLLL